MIPHTSIWGASQRMYYLAKHLKECEYDVTVLHASFGLFDTDKKIDFKTVPVKIKPGFIQEHQNRIQKPTTENEFSDNKKRKSIIKVTLKKIYHFLEKITFNDFGPIGFPVLMWNRQAWTCLKRLYKKNQPITFVLSGPYFGTFSLIKKIKKYFPHSKIIIDYRDPWNLLQKGSIYTMYKEKKFIELCDKVSFFSEKYKMDMCKNFNVKPEKCITVYNGYDSKTWDIVENNIKSKKTTDKLVLSYVGSHITFDNDYRNPSKLLSALSSFEDAQDLIVNFVGCHNKPQNFNTKAQVNFISLVPHQKALEYMLCSDILVVLSTDEYPSKYIVTGKLFDCIRSGAFILAISNNKNVDYVQKIEELGIGVHCENNELGIREKLKLIHEKWVKNSIDRFHLKDRHKFSRQYQNQKLISSLGP